MVVVIYHLLKVIRTYVYYHVILLPTFPGTSYTALVAPQLNLFPGGSYQGISVLEMSLSQASAVQIAASPVDSISY